jgi:hypothetical protein
MAWSDEAEADLRWLETVETAKVASTRPGVFGAYTMMKKFLLLAFIAVASEAMAQEAQCVPERAAMVEIIRAYARSSASLLGPEGISERVLEALGQTERHRFIPGRSCSVAYMDGPVLIGQGQTISQPFIVALMTHLAAVQVRRHHPGSWHGFRLPGCSTGASGAKGLYR